MEKAINPTPPTEADVDRALGDKMLFDIPEARRFGGPTPPVIYRARRAGMIELISIGGRTKIPRAEMKRILLGGLGKVSFQYGKKNESGTA
jgi:hypothetical protein